MEKPDATTDSEDEAFESADEGDDRRSDGPSHAGNGPNSAADRKEPSSEVKEDQSQDGSKKSLGDSITEVAEVSIEGSEDKVEAVVGEEKEEGKQGDEQNLKECGDEVLTQTKHEGEQNIGKGIDTNEDNSKCVNSENMESAKEETEVSNDDKQSENEENVSNESPQHEPSSGTDSKEGDDSNDIKKEESEDDSAIKEPSIVPIHEVNKDEAGGETSLPVAQAMDRLAGGSDKKSDGSDASSGGWGWGGWGSMITKATSSVSTMLETVETQLGIPSPLDMAKLATKSGAEETSGADETTAQEKDELAEKETAEKSCESAEAKSKECKLEEEQPTSSSGLGSWLSGFGVSKISSMVQNTGKEIVTGSLDALEFVGKKTFDAISHGDPAFRKRRGMTLSQALREAKETAQQGNTQATELTSMDKFSLEFDKYQGLAHLEALEIISHESEAEVEKILEGCSEESKIDSDEMIKMLQEKFKISEDEEESEGTEDFENFEEIIREQIAILSLSVSPGKLLAAYSTAQIKTKKDDDENASPDDDKTISPEDVFADSISCFAEMTARSVELFHKIGELMLLPDVKASFLAKTRADSVKKITETLRATVSCLSTKFATTLNEMNAGNDDVISKFITDVYLEATNSSTYINDSYSLLLPIFLLSAVKS
eukprot:Seg1880.5 transcript_id=Seg1880.5/GoldUCD/mRNA.D3Y31 product="Protein FAM114A2" protein_id=Seg1880.5/GoldUCD/D3Y31